VTASSGVTRPSFVLIKDLQDTPEHHRRLMGLHRPDKGQVVVCLPADCHGPDDAAIATLEALGRTKGIAARGVTNQAAILGWLAALKTRSIVITRGHLATGAVVEMLGSVAALCSADLHFVLNASPSRSLRSSLADWGTDELRFDEWSAASEPTSPGTDDGRARRPTRAADAVDRLTAADLPLTDYVTFRADLQRGLAPKQFAELDAEYREATKAMTELLWDPRSNSEAGPFSIAEERDVSRWLEQRFARRSVARRLAGIRGAQAGACAVGVRMGVRAERLMYKRTAGEDRVLTTAELEEIVGAESQPQNALIVGLLSSGSSLEDLCLLATHDVSVVADRVNVDGRNPVVVVSKVVALAMRAHLASRSFAHGTLRPDWLFTNLDGSALHVTTMKQIVRRVAERSPYPIDWLGTERRVQRNWIYRHGISLSRLAGAQMAPPA
jgi:hypothetical protein